MTSTDPSKRSMKKKSKLKENEISSNILPPAPKRYKQDTSSLRIASNIQQGVHSENDKSFEISKDNESEESESEESEYENDEYEDDEYEDHEYEDDVRIKETEVGNPECESEKPEDDKSVKEKTIKRKEEYGREIFEKDEFHFLECIIRNRTCLRLIVIDDLSNNKCYSFGRTATDQMRCLGCMAKKSTCSASFSRNREKVYIDRNRHVCEPKLYSEEIRKLWKPILITGKPLFASEGSEGVESVKEKTIKRKKENGKEVYEKDEFHYVEFIIKGKNCLRLIVIDDLSNNKCYTFGQNQGKMKCLGCSEQKKSRQAWISENKVYIDKNSHVCEPRTYSEDVRKLINAKIVTGKSIREYEEDKDVYENDEFHYLQYDVRDKTGYKLIIINDLSNNKFYTFGSNGYGKMKCLGCNAKRKNCYASFSKKKQKVSIRKNEHVCEPRIYTEEINKLLNPKLITGKPLFDDEFVENYENGEIFEAGENVIYEKKEEVFQENQFHYVKTVDDKSKLIIISNDNNYLCYSFGRRKGNNMLCLNCIIMGTKCVARISKDKKKIYVKDSHVCRPQFYSEVLKNLAIADLISGKPIDHGEKKLIYKSHEFHYLQHNNLKTAILILDDGLCYDYKHIGNYKNSIQKLSCSGCRSMNRYNPAYLSEYKIEILVKAIDHVCQPKNYLNEMCKLSKSILICGKDFDPNEHIMERKPTCDDKPRDGYHRYRREHYVDAPVNDINELQVVENVLPMEMW